MLRLFLLTVLRYTSYVRSICSDDGGMISRFILEIDICYDDCYVWTTRILGILYITILTDRGDTLRRL